MNYPNRLFCSHLVFNRFNLTNRGEAGVNNAALTGQKSGRIHDRCRRRWRGYFSTAFSVTAFSIAATSFLVTGATFVILFLVTTMTEGKDVIKQATFGTGLLLLFP